MLLSSTTDYATIGEQKDFCILTVKLIITKLYLSVREYVVFFYQYYLSTFTFNDCEITT